MTDRQYKARNVDLSLLSQWIEQFFKRREFRAVREAKEKGHEIVARPTHVHEIVDSITVSVSGDSNDFVLKFRTGTRSEAMMRLGQLTHLFGGGVLFLRGVKSDEAEEKLERDFWIFIEEKIDFLAKSNSSAEKLMRSRR